MSGEKNPGERIASLEATVVAMNNGITELKKTVEDGFKEMRAQIGVTNTSIEKTNKSIGDLDGKYLTIKDFNEAQKNNSEKQEEIKKIATTRLWQAVALTALLSFLLTYLATFFLTNVKN